MSVLFRGLSRISQHNAALLALFLLSGAAGLVYEVAWTRQIGLLFGQTVQAASVVLSCFFCGMALGYALAKRRWVRRMAPLKAYALAEGVIAVWALIIPLLITLLESSAASALINAPQYGLQLLARVAVSMVLLLPATIAMGATLPLMIGALELAADGKEVTSLAYSVNIFGGFLGVAFGTLFLLPAAGVYGSTYWAAGFSGLCALVAWKLGKGGASQSLGTAPEAAAAPPLSRRWLALAAVSGFSVLALQVLYMRLFSLVFHNSVYTFGVVVALFLVALSLGAAASARLASRFDLDSLIANACYVSGIAVASSVMFFLLWTELDYFEAGKDFHSYILGAAMFCGAVVLLPVTAAGVILPLTWRGARTSSDHQQVVVAGLTSVNTFAAAGGSLAVSFVLLPLIGIWGSFTAIAALYLLAGFVLSSAKTRRQLGPVVAGFIFCGAFYYAARTQNGATEDETILQRWESAYGWIDVVEFRETGHKQLRQNVHYGLGSTSSVSMERRQGHIPLLLHPDPKNVLFIGLATGITAGSALDHEGIKVDVVELIPDVVRGARLFSETNRGILDHERATIMINDGRHYLGSTDKFYDVIVADLFVPWESHTGYLYTEENYRTTLRRLADGGLYCQWLPMWQIGSEEFELIADTFASVFPHTSVWYGKLDKHWTIVGLVGSRSPLVLSAERLTERLAKKPPPLAKDTSWFKSPDALFRMYAGDWPARPGRLLNTDNHPRLEFQAPVTAWTPGSRLRFDSLRTFQKDVLMDLASEGVRLTPVGGQAVTSRELVRKFQSDALAD